VQPRITLCSVCHSQMPAGQSYCKNCGSTLCPHCREILPQRSRFCPKCGFLCVTEQQIVTPPVRPATSARPQAMPVPRAAMAVPQAAAPAPIPQQSFGSPAALHQRNCPKCGARIDHELGRCTGCGLLYAVKHRVMQQAAPTSAAPIPRPPASWPQSSMGQQPQAAYNAMPQYNSPRHSVPPPTSGQHQNYMPAVAMPHPGMLMPIPRIAPAAPGTMSPGAPVPPMPYQYHAAPPASIERRAPASRRGGLSGFATTLIIIMCLLVGSGVYYFFIRNETAPTVNNVVNNSLLKVLDVAVQSTTEKGATIKWSTDKPATSSVTITDPSGAIITETEPQATLDTSYSVAVSGLQPNTTYHYKIIFTDATGTETTSEGNLTTTTAVTTDKTAPTISGVNVSNITESGAIITWLTNEPATSQVEYGKTETYGSTTTIDTNLTTSHSIMLTKLDSGTTYNFSIISKDAAGNQATSTSNQTFKTLTPIPVGTQVGNRAPDFALKDLSGKDVKLSDFAGKIVIINFWAIWCDPCKTELPYIQAISDNWSGKGVQVLAIASKVNERLDTVGQFMDQNKYTFRVLYDSKGINSVYNVAEIPITFFIDKEGIIRNVHDQFDDQATIENILKTIQ
jgi:peroxiredoxin